MLYLYQHSAADCTPVVLCEQCGDEMTETGEVGPSFAWLGKAKSIDGCFECGAHATQVKGEAK